MTPTIATLRSIYTEFNAKYFNNELPKNLPIKLSARLTRCLGKTYGENRYDYYTCDRIIVPTCIKISTRFEFLDEKQVANVMCHEMVHIWQYINNKADGHGYYFMQKAREIQKRDSSMIITEKHKEAINGVCRLGKSDAIIIVWNRGKQFFCTKTKEENVQRFLRETASQYKDSTLFGVFEASGSMWTRIRNCNKRILWYFFTEENFMNKVYPTLTNEITDVA